MKAQVLVVDLLSNAIGAYLVLFFLFIGLQGKTGLYKPLPESGVQYLPHLWIEIEAGRNDADIDVRVYPPGHSGKPYETLSVNGAPVSFMRRAAECIDVADDNVRECRHLTGLNGKYQNLSAGQQNHYLTPMWIGKKANGHTTYKHEIMIPKPQPGCWRFRVDYAYHYGVDLATQGENIDVSLDFDFDGYSSFKVKEARRSTAETYLVNFIKSVAPVSQAPILRNISDLNPLFFEVSIPDENNPSNKC